MSHIVYYRVSTTEQAIETQRSVLEAPFDKEFSDLGVPGAVMAADRPGFSDLLSCAREGDVVHVFAIDGLGRDALDIQRTLRTLLARGVTVEVRGLGTVGNGAGDLILAVLDQVADLERQRIRERCEAGREKARKAIASTGKTHKGKKSLGRPLKADKEVVKAWREANNASLSQTAQHFGLSAPTVKRYCA